MRLLYLMPALTACAPDPVGLRATPAGSGPLVRVDWDAEPLPDIPFPNDLATRPDPTSPTGLRLNLPVEADVELEVHSRQLLDELSGFGIFAPLWVGFDEPLDLAEILRRHRDDLGRDGAFHDDAFLVIDVTPGSPTLGEPVPLEVGFGRFPQDAAELGQFLPNDPRADQPSLLWETGEEDLDLDGRIGPGEDTDGDGILDHPNLWPPGATDPRHQLLDWYDLQTDTLWLRPVVPLREETTYAVVLTEDLLGQDGQPVRSPWEWVHHTRQTGALRPVIGALEALDRGVDDIAFAWTFTTGSITRELFDVTEGLRGTGPFAALASQYPAGVTEGHELHTLPDVENRLFLPVKYVIDPLNAIGLIPDVSLDFVSDAYLEFTAGIVGGAFRSPYLLHDKDDGGRDDSDEHWVIDPVHHTVSAESRRVVFTCAVPKAGGDIQPPWPVVIHAHGYGSTRAELVAFAYAWNRMGMVGCSIDSPGQGLSLDESLEEVIGGMLGLDDTEPLWWHALDARVRDLDNDREPDPAGDTFPADAFHARDVIRQLLVDQAQLIRSLQRCGIGTMEKVVPTEEGPVHTGEEVIACDWNGDGYGDFGGVDGVYLLHGVSQGGILTSLGAAVHPVEAAVVTVPGGGLADVVGRTEIGQVSDGMVGRALSPLVLGRPGPEGTLAVTQLVVSVDRTAELPIGTLPAVPAGGTVIVRNLDLGTEERGVVPESGAFRVPIAANALDPAEKAIATGMPRSGPEVVETYSTPRNEGLGDRLEIEIRDADDQVVAVLDRFAERVIHEGVTMEAGSPLVAGSYGLGLRRGSADLKRLVGVLSMAIEGGDPIAYARRWEAEPFDAPTKVLIHLTAGDSLVPIASGISLARAAGLVDFRTVDPRWDTTADRFLIDRGVVEGLEEHGPYRDAQGAPILFDADDLDDGTDLTGAPSEAPLRAFKPVGDGVSGLRILYVEPTGTHAYLLPDQSLPFDWHLFAGQQMSWFLATRGRELSDDACLAEPDCDFLRPMP